MSERKIFKQFKAPVSSFELMEVNQGIYQSGRYRGFDGISTVSNSTGVNRIKITHGPTSFRRVDPSGTQAGVNSGALVFPNGFVVHDWSEPELDVEHQGAGDRVDAIVATLNYQAVQGASTVTYSIQKGVGINLSGVSLSPSQVLVGTLSRPENSTNFSSISHKFSPTPPLANGDMEGYPKGDKIAFKDRSNTFSENQVLLKDISIGGNIIETVTELTQSALSSGRIVLAQNSSNNIILNGNGNNLDIRGFEISGRPFGSDPSVNLTRGTSIKVRFVNIGATTVFKSANLEGHSSDFTLRAGILYTIRYEGIPAMEFGGSTTRLFSISPTATHQDISSLDGRITTNENNISGNVTNIATLDGYRSNLELIPFPSGVTGLSGGAVGIIRKFYGIVQLHFGLKRTGTIASGTPTIRTLETKYRPLVQIDFFNPVLNSGSNFILISIMTNGEVKLTNGNDLPLNVDVPFSVSYNALISNT